MSEENKSKKDLKDAAQEKAEELKKKTKETVKDAKESVSEKVEDLKETDKAHQEAEVVVESEDEGLWDSIKEVTVKQALLILGGFFAVMLLISGLDSSPGKKNAVVADRVVDGAEMSDSAKRLLSGADEKVSAVATGTKDAAKDLVKGSGKILGKLTDKASGALSGVAGAVKEGTSGIVEGTKNAVEGASEVVKDGASAAVSGAKNVVEGTTEVVKDGASAVAVKASEVVEDTKEALIVKGDNAKGVSGSWSESAKREKSRAKKIDAIQRRNASATQNEESLKTETAKTESNKVVSSQNKDVEVKTETASSSAGQDISAMAQSSAQLAKDIEAKKAVISELQAEVTAMEAKIDGLKGFIGSADSETTRTIREQIILWKGLLDEKERDLKEAEEDLQ